MKFKYFFSISVSDSFKVFWFVLSFIVTSSVSESLSKPPTNGLTGLKKDCLSTTGFGCPMEYPKVSVCGIVVVGAGSFCVLFVSIKTYFSWQ